MLRTLVSNSNITIGKYRLTWEAVQVDCPQQFEEADTMFWELCKVLVDHVQGRLKHSVQYRRDLGREQRLNTEVKNSRAMRSKPDLPLGDQ